VIKGAALRTAMATALATGLSSASWPGAALAQQLAPSVIPAIGHDESLPLSVLAQITPSPGTPGEVEVLPAPRPTEPKPEGPAQADSVVQDFAGAPLGTNDFTTDPDDFVNVDGIGQTSGPAPPDTNGAIGATQYMEWANSRLAIYDKATGALILGPMSGSTLFSGMGLPCQSNRGDGVILYDRIDGRWMFSQLVTRADGSGRIDPFSVCIAVSTTSDATGSYNRYLFDLSGVLPAGTTLSDYPKFGAWPDGYYYTANIFGSMGGTNLCAFDRVNMVQGNDATAQCFFSNTFGGSYLPADMDGTNLPPAGSPNPMVDLSGSSALRIIGFQVDFSNPDNTQLIGPTIVPVAPFTRASGGVPQLDTTNTLDTLGDRLMFRNAYRNFGDHESLVLTHSVSANGTIGVRWYELQDPNGSPFAFQQSTYVPDTTFRWMGSIAMDQAGDIAVGYSASSSSIHPAIRYAGRMPSDPLGILAAENSIVEGAGSQTGTLHRWGDYSALTVDPVDDCTFWFTTEYHQNSGTSNWNTRIASFSFPSCGSSGAIPPGLPEP
jgi:hypothetical protein